MAKKNQAASGCGCLVLGVAALAVIGSCQQRGTDRGAVSKAPAVSAVQPSSSTAWDLTAPKPPDGWPVERRRAWWVAKNKQAAEQKRINALIDKSLAEDQQWRTERASKPAEGRTRTAPPISTYQSPPAFTGTYQPVPAVRVPAYTPPAYVPSAPARSGRGGRCNPTGICRACSDCSSCGHCSSGGTCSVCRR
jgi:hypothetical protein